MTTPKPVEDQPQVDRPPPVFMLSGMSQAEKHDYGALIEQLGGKLIDSQMFDHRCTHLVINKVEMTEKFLASVAIGNWVLTKQYLEACRQERKFVEEELYEWGSEGTLGLVQTCSEVDKSMASAARRWRIRVQQEKQSNPAATCGAFCDWRVVLCCGKNDASYKRLLAAGGAAVVNVKPPFTRRIDATHVLWDPSEVPLPKDDQEALFTSGCLCVRSEYISAHLSDPSPNPDTFCPDEIKALKLVQGGPVRRIVQPRIVGHNYDVLPALILQVQDEMETRMAQILEKVETQDCKMILTVTKVSALQGGGGTVPVKQDRDAERVGELERQISALTERRIEYMETLQAQQMDMQVNLLSMTRDIPGSRSVARSPEQHRPHVVPKKKSRTDLREERYTAPGVEMEERTEDEKAALPQDVEVPLRCQVLSKQKKKKNRNTDMDVIDDVQKHDTDEMEAKANADFALSFDTLDNRTEKTDPSKELTSKKHKKKKKDKKLETVGSDKASLLSPVTGTSGGDKSSVPAAESTFKPYDYSQCAKDLLKVLPKKKSRTDLREERYTAPGVKVEERNEDDKAALPQDVEFPLQFQVLSKKKKKKNRNTDMDVIDAVQKHDTDEMEAKANDDFALSFDTLDNRTEKTDPSKELTSKKHKNKKKDKKLEKVGSEKASLLSPVIGTSGGDKSSVPAAESTFKPYDYSQCAKDLLKVLPKKKSRTDLREERYTAQGVKVEESNEDDKAALPQDVEFPLQFQVLSKQKKKNRNTDMDVIDAVQKHDTDEMEEKANADFALSFDTLDNRTEKTDPSKELTSKKHKKKKKDKKLEKVGSDKASLLSPVTGTSGGDKSSVPAAESTFKPYDYSQCAKDLFKVLPKKKSRTDLREERYTAPGVKMEERNEDDTAALPQDVEFPLQFQVLSKKKKKKNRNADMDVIDAVRKHDTDEMEAKANADFALSFDTLDNRTEITDPSKELTSKKRKKKKKDKKLEKVGSDKASLHSPVTGTSGGDKSSAPAAESTFKPYEYSQCAKDLLKVVPKKKSRTDIREERYTAPGVEVEERTEDDKAALPQDVEVPRRFQVLSKKKKKKNRNTDMEVIDAVQKHDTDEMEAKANADFALSFDTLDNRTEITDPSKELTSKKHKKKKKDKKLEKVGSDKASLHSPVTGTSGGDKSSVPAAESTFKPYDYSQCAKDLLKEKLDYFNPPARMKKSRALKRARKRNNAKLPKGVSKPASKKSLMSEQYRREQKYVDVPKLKPFPTLGQENVPQAKPTDPVATKKMKHGDSDETGKKRKASSSDSSQKRSRRS